MFNKDLLIKIIGKTLSCRSGVDKSGHYYLHGEYAAEHVKTVVYTFIQKYLLCSSCDKPEVNLKYKNGKIKQKCRACGSNVYLQNCKEEIIHIIAPFDIYTFRHLKRRFIISFFYKKNWNHFMLINITYIYKMNAVIIDNCIVSKFMGNGLKIRPISLEQKINPSFNINSLKKITYGSRLNDNKIIQRLSDGILKYEDLNFNSAF